MLYCAVGQDFESCFVEIVRAFGLVLTKNGDETQCNLVPGGGKMKDPGNETGCNALPTAKQMERRRFLKYISFVTEQYLILLVAPTKCSPWKT